MTRVTSTPRVMQVVLSLNAGGTERLVVEIVRRLHAEVPMAVCCLDEEGIWAGELRDSGVAVHVAHRPAGFSPGVAGAVAAAARTHGATVLHCHHYSPFVYGALARIWRPRTRVVYTEHGRLSDAPPSPKRRWANTVLGRLPSAVFTVSGDLRQHLIEEGLAAEAVGVIYNGIDIGPLPRPNQRTDMRGRLGLDANTFVIGTIARLDPVKDLGTLIRAVASIETAALIVVGDGPERLPLTAVAREAGAAARIHFLGHRDDARAWLAACDVYVNSSISEGVSLTILEAMAAGLPVVATRVGGTPEVVDEASGRLVPARDADALADMLRKLSADSALRQQLGAGARRRVEARFTLDRMVREYLDVYRGLS